MKNAELFPPIPADTSRIARAVYGSSNFYMATGDQVNRLFRGLLPPAAPRPDQIPARLLAELYMITVFQYLETLPDSQAVDAVRERRDWKYALHLPLNISRFQPTMFCQFRKLLLVDPASLQNLQVLLSRLAEIGKGNGRLFNEEAGQVILRVCSLSRVASVVKGMSQALEALALRQPEWLREASQPHWYERYSYPHGKLNLNVDSCELDNLAEAIGCDADHLLAAVAGQPSLADLAEVNHLRWILDGQYQRGEGKVVWRQDTCANCAMISRSWEPFERSYQIE